MKIAITSFKIWLLLVLIVTMVALSSQQKEPKAQKRIKRRIKRCLGEHNQAGITKKIGATWTEIEEASGISAECRCIEYKELLWFSCDVPGCRDATKKCKWQGCVTEVGGEYEPYYPLDSNVVKPKFEIITYPHRCLCKCLNSSEASQSSYIADAPQDPFVWDCDCDQNWYYYDEPIEEDKQNQNEIEERKRRKRSTNV
ncbi:unnamed protein product [Owenia fusiformis]|uniref:Uncharacterized protein n=1 Tax=Owenia fusiformis TaxID=6347 RepID=A0A8S4NI91_OWEFU|nr:unnamed protein product [Owenia fusiformis]